MPTTNTNTQPSGFLHAAITVENLDRSVAFYRDLLGLRLVVRQLSTSPYIGALTGYPGAELEVALLEMPGGSPLLELVEYHHPRGPTGAVESNSTAGHHLAFTTLDVDGVFTALQAAGVEFVSTPVAISEGVNTGAKGVYFLDPDGHVLELHQRAPRGGA